MVGAPLTRGAALSRLRSAGRTTGVAVLSRPQVQVKHVGVRRLAEGVAGWMGRYGWAGEVTGAGVVGLRFLTQL